MKKKFKLQDLDCANCAAKMEEKEDQDKKILKCLDECPIIVYDGNSVYFSRRKEE